MQARDKLIFVPLWVPVFCLLVAAYLGVLWYFAEANGSPTPPAVVATRAATPVAPARVDRETPTRKDRKNPYPGHDFQLLDAGLAQFQGDVVTASSLGITMEVGDKLIFVRGASFSPEPSARVDVLGRIRRLGHGFLVVNSLSVGLIRPATLRSMHRLRARKKRILAGWAYGHFVVDSKVASFIENYNTAIPAGKAEQMADWITRLCRKHRVDPYLVTAVVASESAFQTHATSPVGAMGLGQLMPGTARALGVDNPYDAHQNLDGCVRYLGGLLHRWSRSRYPVELALASYNAGPNAVRRYGGIPPYPETVHYVHEVITLYDSMTD